MSMHNVKMWTVKLKAARHEEQQWAKAYNKAERALTRIGHEIQELESKIAAAKQAEEKLFNELTGQT